MQRDGETVQMADVQWAEIMMEGIVQERVVDREVHRFQPGRVDDLVRLALRGTTTTGSYHFGRDDLVRVRDHLRWEWGRGGGR
jgi:hypothetical protein